MFAEIVGGHVAHSEAITPAFEPAPWRLAPLGGGAMAARVLAALAVGLINALVRAVGTSDVDGNSSGSYLDHSEGVVVRPSRSASLCLRDNHGFPLD